MLLLHWVRAAAVRLTVDQRRLEKDEVPIDEHLAEVLPVEGSDPELAFIQAEHRAAFKAAFRTALLGLSSQDRSVLRMHLVEGLNIDQIGSFYRVHRTTAFRRIVAAKQALLEETKRLLTDKLKLGRADLNSLMGMVRSRIDVSISAYLKKSGG